MNKLLIMCGLAVVSTTFTPEAVKSPTVCEPLQLEAEYQKAAPVVHAENQSVLWDAPAGIVSLKTVAMDELDLKSIPFVEEEDIADLGFDTELYLPSGFDPYKTWFDLDAVAYIEDVADELDFGTANYLPDGFNAYATPSDFMSISFIEDDADEDPGFDTAPYLPAGFDAYEVRLDLKTIVYIEEEEDITLGFDTATYLPAGFNPYSR